MFDPHGHALRLTHEQQAVVAHGPGPSIVVSGAGTGKTTVLLMRVARLIRDGVSPHAICMVTFAKRGSADMQRRAARLGVPSGVQYRTLHSVSWSIIEAAARTRQPEVPHNWKLVRVTKNELEAIARKMPYRDRKTLPKPSDVLHEIALAKANMIWPNEIDYDTSELVRPGSWHSPVLGKEIPSYFDWAIDRPRDRIGPKLARIMERCYGKLEATCRRPESAGFDQDAGLRWVTYDDMVALVARGILTGAPWTHNWYAWKPVMLIDEVQDNAPVNWVTCEFLAGPDRHIMAVGDDMQSIFAWRGSDPMLMQDYQARHPDIAVYHLTTNFRSGSAILEPMNELVKHAPNTLNKGLVCGTGRVGSTAVVRYTNSSEEAREVVTDIRVAIEEGTDPDEISVLYRINASSGLLEMQLIEAGIPYRVAGSSFFKRGEIKAAIGYLGCALNPQDEECWRGCANAPTRYLGGKFFSAFPTLAAAEEGLANGELGRWLRGVRSARRVVQRVRDLLGKRGLRTTLTYIFDEAGVRDHFREEGAGKDDETEVDEACDCLVSCAGSLVTGVSMRRKTDALLSDGEEVVEGAEAAEGVEDAEKLTNTEAAADALVRFAKEMVNTGTEDYTGERSEIPRVTLSTIHKAKGLEWGRVYVIGNNPGLFPLGDAPEAEERRLFYVAGTRAKDLCRYSYSDVTPTEQVVAPSQFLIEAGLIENPYVEDEEETSETSGTPQEEANESGIPALTPVSDAFSF